MGHGALAALSPIVIEGQLGPFEEDEQERPLLPGVGDRFVQRGAPGRIDGGEPPPQVVCQGPSLGLAHGDARGHIEPRGTAGSHQSVHCPNEGHGPGGLDG